MNFLELSQIQDETEQVQKTYEIFHEDLRLNRSKAARVEFLTTVRYIERYLKPGDRILDIGAGAGEYRMETIQAIVKMIQGAEKQDDIKTMIIVP